MTLPFHALARGAGVGTLALLSAFSNLSQGSVQLPYPSLDHRLNSVRAHYPTRSPAPPRAHDMTLLSYPNSQHPFLVELCGRAVVMNSYPSEGKFSSKLCTRREDPIENTDTFIMLARTVAEEFSHQLSEGAIVDVIRVHNMEARVEDVWNQAGCARVALSADKNFVPLDRQPIDDMVKSLVDGRELVYRHPADGNAELFLCVRPARQLETFSTPGRGKKGPVLHNTELAAR